MKRWFTFLFVLAILYVGRRFYLAAQELIDTTAANMQLNAKDR